MTPIVKYTCNPSWNNNKNYKLDMHYTETQCILLLDSLLFTMEFLNIFLFLFVPLNNEWLNRFGIFLHITGMVHKSVVSHFLTDLMETNKSLATALRCEGFSGKVLLLHQKSAAGLIRSLSVCNTSSLYTYIIIVFEKCWDQCFR